MQAVKQKKSESRAKVAKALTQQKQPEKATGILGSFFPDMSADTQDRLAVGLSGLSMHPNHAAVGAASDRIKARRDAAQQPDQQGFVIGGTTGLTPEQLKAKRYRAIADAMMRSQGRPQNVGQGLYDASGRILGALMHRRADKALQQGVPAFRHGTNFAPGGMALVGEDGPELVNLPRGSQVIPNPRTQPQQGAKTGNKTVDYLMKSGRTDLVQAVQSGQMSANDAFRMAYDDYDRGGPASDPLAHRKWLQQQIDQMTPEERQRLMEYDPASQQRMQGDPQATQPAPMDMRELLPQEQSSFQPGAEYKTADMSAIEPSGVGERNQLNAAARSFQGLMKSLEDYENLFADGGATMWPGTRKDQLDTAHRDLQMQMKELYNLGVLNGPDLMLMDQILISPTSIMGNVKDGLGIADMEKRIPQNIKDVRRMMTNRTAPALQQLGLKPEDLMPKQEPQDLQGRSTDELLQMLTGG